jgi:hypothetical protein
MNCSNVVGAVELRARGFDVIARPIPGAVGRFHPETAVNWRDADGNVRLFTNFDELPGVTGAQKIKAFTEDWEDGARGFLSGKFKSGGGHIFNIEKANGKIIIHEGQNPDASFDNVQTYMTQMKTGSLNIMRVDDLVPTNAVLTDLVEEATPDRLAQIVAERGSSASAAYIRERIVRIEQRLADVPEVKAQVSEAAGVETDTIKRLTASVVAQKLESETVKELKETLQKMKDYLLRA